MFCQDSERLSIMGNFNANDVALDPGPYSSFPGRIGKKENLSETSITASIDKPVGRNHIGDH